MIWYNLHDKIDLTFSVRGDSFVCVCVCVCVFFSEWYASMCINQIDDIWHITLVTQFYRAQAHALARVIGWIGQDYPALWWNITYQRR